VEAHRFGQVLRNVVEERGTGILVVEHDMTFVSEVCDYVYVMDFGLLIYEGSAAETMQSDIVRSAYLGTEEVTVGAPSEPGITVPDAPSAPIEPTSRPEAHERRHLHAGIKNVVGGYGGSSCWRRVTHGSTPPSWRSWAERRGQGTTMRMASACSAAIGPGLLDGTDVTRPSAPAHQAASHIFGRGVFRR
jgi:hypothetical protein